MLHLFLLINNLFMTIEMNRLLNLNNTSEEIFENKLFNPFDFQQIMADEGNDLDLNYFNNHPEAVILPYYTIDEFSCACNNLLKNSFSILQIKIRSMNKNFEKLHECLNVVKGKFSIIALTETWCNDDRADKNSAWQISNHTSILQIRQTGQKGGGIPLFVHNNFDFRIIERGNLCNDDIEYLTVEILKNKDKNIILKYILKLYINYNSNSQII